MAKKYSGFKYIFFFCSLFFLEWTFIKSENIAVLNGLSLSLILMILFLIINIHRVDHCRVSKWEFVFAFILVVEIFCGMLVSLRTGNYAGIRRFINGYIGIIIFYLGVRRCYSQFSDIFFRKKLIKTLYNGVFYLTVIMGGGQVLFILTGNHFLYDLLNGLTYRELVYLEAGKVQLFTEPSLFGEIFFIIYVPAAYYLLKNNIYKKKKIIYSSILVFVINLLGVSVRFFVDMIVFFSIYSVVKIYVEKSKAMLRVLFGLIVVFIVIIGILYFDWFGLVEKNHAIERIHNILIASDSVSNDASGSVRMEYLRCAWQGFLQKPLTGWGAGNYVEALSTNARPLNNVMANTELMQACKQMDMVSYSFVFSQLCENGLLGVLFVLNVFYLLFKMINKRHSVIMNTLSLFIMYMFVQNEMIGCFSIVLVLAFYNYNLLKRNYSDNCENGLIKVGRSTEI